MLEYIILGFLMYSDTSGYDLKQKMTRSTSYFFDASFGSIYPALKRLVQKEMVTFQEIIVGSKYKKVYQINDSGRECFMKWIKEPIVFEKTRHDHLVKIFFYKYLPKDEAIANLKAFVKEIEPVVNKLILEKDKVAEKYDTYQVFYGYSTMIYGIDYFHLIISWCNDLIKELETNPLTQRSERLNNSKT